MKDKYTEVEYYRDDNGKWGILVNGQGNLPVSKESSALMEVAYKVGMQKVIDWIIENITWDWPNDELLFSSKLKEWEL